MQDAHGGDAKYTMLSIIVLPPSKGIGKKVWQHVNPKDHPKDARAHLTEFSPHVIKISTLLVTDLFFALGVREYSGEGRHEGSGKKAPLVGLRSRIRISDVDFQVVVFRFLDFDLVPS